MRTAAGPYNPQEAIGDRIIAPDSSEGNLALPILKNAAAVALTGTAPPGVTSSRIRAGRNVVDIAFNAQDQKDAFHQSADNVSAAVGARSAMASTLARGRPPNVGPNTVIFRVEMLIDSDEDSPER